MKRQESGKFFEKDCSYTEELRKIFAAVLISIEAKLSESPKNTEKLINLAGNMKKIQAINEENWRFDGVDALNKFYDAVEGLKDILNIDEELDDIDGLLDTIKSILEDIEKGKVSSLSDLMDAIIPVMGILMPLIEYGLEKVA